MKSIDLTSVTQRTELRFPPPPAPECGSAGCCMGSAIVFDPAADPHERRAVAVSITSLDKQKIDPREPTGIEFRIMNSGLVPISIPVSPHLTDLQPDNEYRQFTYNTLAVVATATLKNSEFDNFFSAGRLEVFGCAEHPETMITLKPGEWIRLNGKVKFNPYATHGGAMNLKGGLALQERTFKPSPGEFGLEVRNIYMNATPTPSLEVEFVDTDPRN